jgi:serine protease Do
MRSELRSKCAALSALAAVLLSACSEARPVPSEQIRSSGFVEPVERVGPAVVHIRVEKGVRVPAMYDPFSDPFSPYGFGRRQREYTKEGQGTGVIVSRDGLIVTNHHVVGEADRIEVRLADGSSLRAQLVGTDEATDLAVIKIEGNNYPFAVLGDSDEVRVGEWALAIGNPFGLDNTVTLGIISARGRQGISGLGSYEDFIQTDAAVNPGNSGGPLINTAGEVIGINSAIISRSGGYDGIAFAIPANLVKLIMKQLVDNGRVTRAWLGVGIQDVTSELAPALGLTTPQGIVVTSIMPGTPAARAGIEVQDVITAVDGKSVSTAGDLRNKIAHSPVGSKAELDIVRGGRPMRLTATLGELPVDRTAESPAKSTWREENPSDGKLGVFLQELTPSEARSLGLEYGLMVTKVRSGGLAASAGLEKGEIVVEANRKPMRSLRDFAEVVADLEGGDSLLLLVRSRGGTRFVVIRPR